MNNHNHSENNTDLEVFWKSQIKNYEDFMGSRAGIEKNSLGCYRINLTRNICSEGYKKKGRDIKLLDNVSVDAFLNLYVYALRMKKGLMNTKEFLTGIIF